MRDDTPPLSLFHLASPPSLPILRCRFQTTMSNAHARTQCLAKRKKERHAPMREEESRRSVAGEKQWGAASGTIRKGRWQRRRHVRIHATSGYKVFGALTNYTKEERERNANEAGPGLQQCGCWEGRAGKRKVRRDGGKLVLPIPSQYTLPALSLRPQTKKNSPRATLPTFHFLSITSSRTHGFPFPPPSLAPMDKSAKGRGGIFSTIFLSLSRWHPFLLLPVVENPQ